MKTMVVAGTAGMAMMTAGGWLGALGWILFVASVAWGIFQQTVINKLKDELKFEREEREKLSKEVAELRESVKKLRGRIMDEVEEKYLTSREADELRKDMELMRQANDRNMETIAKLAEKYGDV